MSVEKDRKDRKRRTANERQWTQTMIRQVNGMRKVKSRIPERTTWRATGSKCFTLRMVLI
jgi:hypothetical protein